MNNGLNDGKVGYLHLFDGIITGEVKDPHSRKVYSRRDIMNFYRDLLYRACSPDVDSRSLHMLDMIKEVLQVPMDIHQSLLEEVSRLGRKKDQRIQNPYLEREMNKALDVWLVEKPVYEGTDPRWTQKLKVEAARNTYLEELDPEYPAESLDMEKSGLISSMKDDDIELASDHVFSVSTRIIPSHKRPDKEA
ncbi:MAG: hypothetical protein ACMUIG_09790 [Thermoplasmatota archaeon]